MKDVGIGLESHPHVRSEFLDFDMLIEVHNILAFGVDLHSML